MEVDDEKLEYDEKEFRMNAVKCFLTYSQCGDLTWKQVMERLNEIGPVEQYCISYEDHSNGGRHIHCFVKWFKKVNVTSARRFDIEGHHPNVRRVKDVMGCVEYVIKYGNYESEKLDLYLNSKGFCRKKMDHEAWVQYKHEKLLKLPVYPIPLPQRLGEITQPKACNKQRHWWIVGPPNCGKTKWVNETFKGTTVYMRPAGVNYPYEGYMNQELVIYDDVNMWDLLEELKAVTNTWDVPTHVYGPTRYKKQYWPLGQSRTVIVLSNSPPEYITNLAWQARFKLVEMRFLRYEDIPTPIVVYSDDERQELEEI